MPLLLEPIGSFEPQLLSNGASCSISLLNGTDQSTTHSAADVQLFVVGRAGKLKTCTIKITAAPGAGKTRTFTLVKNGVDTSLVLAFGAADTLKSSLTFALDIAPGDYLYIRNNNTGTPAAASATVTLWFSPSAVKKWLSAGCGQVTTGITGCSGLGGDVYGVGGEEGFPFTDVHLFATSLKHVRYLSRTAMPAGTSITFTIMKNFATTGETFTVAAGETTASWTGSVAYNSGDKFYLKAVPNGATGNIVFYTGMAWENATELHASLYSGRESGSMWSAAPPYYVSFPACVQGPQTVEGSVACYLPKALTVKGFGVGYNACTYTDNSRWGYVWVRNADDLFQIQLLKVGASGSTYVNYFWVINVADSFTTVAAFEQHSAKYTRNGSGTGSINQKAIFMSLWVEATEQDLPTGNLFVPRSIPAIFVIS